MRPGRALLEGATRRRHGRPASGGRRGSGGVRTHRRFSRSQPRGRGHRGHRAGRRQPRQGVAAQGHSGNTGPGDGGIAERMRGRVPLRWARQGTRITTLPRMCSVARVWRASGASARSKLRSIRAARVPSSSTAANRRRFSGLGSPAGSCGPFFPGCPVRGGDPRALFERSVERSRPIGDEIE